MKEAKKDGNNRVSMGTKIKFGAADFGLSALTSLIQFYMLFYYTDVVGISAAVAGTAILVGKLTWDMINDVLCGWVTDRTKSRWGRRRPYLMFCSVPMGLTFWLVLSLPKGMNNIEAFFAILFTFLIYDTFQSMIVAAYYSMTAEITTDYNERTSVATVRMIFNVIGYIFGAGVTTVLAAAISTNFGATKQTAWSIVGLVFGIFAAATVLLTGLTVRSAPAVDSAPSTIPPVKSVTQSLKNRPFLKLLFISGIMSIAFTVVTTMMPYYIKYKAQMENQQALIMFSMLAVLGICLVPCMKISEKIGKAKAYALGLAIAASALMFGFFMPTYPGLMIYAVAVVAGLGFSAQWVCPHSMMPDVIEYDELATGQRREGIFYGIWSMNGKITGAFGSALCGWVLSWVGYVDNAKQSASAMMGIRILFTVVPAVLLFVCVPMLIKYPITRESHAKVVEELKKRKSEVNDDAGENNRKNAPVK